MTSGTEPTKKRPTIPQVWPAYNAAQAAEIETFRSLLKDLCDNIVPPEYRFGRPFLALSDKVYSGALKVYFGFSSRRNEGNIEDARKEGFVDCKPSFSTVNRTIADENLRPVLTELIMRSAAPLNMVEREFAADGSGFSTSRFARWFSEKDGRTKAKRQWLKAHIVVGTKTNIITAVSVTPGNFHDSPELPELLDKTAIFFDMKEVLADKGYLSNANLQYIEHHGAVPYVAMKSNTTGASSDALRRMHGNFIMDPEGWMEHYHQRSNVETTYSMIKGKFGEQIKAKTDTGMVNELLLKVLCHNICVLVQEIHEIGLDPRLGPNMPLHLWQN